MRTTKIILASQSPRRRELLARAGINFEIITSDTPEKTTETSPDKVVKELSLIKAQDVLNKIKAQADADNVIVIGADTIVSVDGEILGKPKTVAEAYEMIEKIQGNTHQVYTGVSILKYNLADKNIEKNTFAECTEVFVYPMTKEEIETYVSTGDCMDKAGAYGIQGDFGVYVKKIHGDYNNVVGLPVARLYHELKEMT